MTFETIYAVSSDGKITKAELSNDAMFFTKDTKSPQEYDQAIFRLCTRRVVSATDEDGNKTKICRKSNVYLIDFKIDRMYTMMVDSAISQCAAQGQTSAEAVKDVIVKNAEIMKTYSENVYDNNGQHILDKMHKIDPDDLLKKYVTYNRERSIEDSIDLKERELIIVVLDFMLL